MIISQIREVRTAFKAFVTAQAVLSEDLLKWSMTIENDALHESFAHLADLSSLWTEVQKDFTDSLKHLKSNFELILEGDRHVDQAKQTYAVREEAERDIRRELHKSYKKVQSEELQLLRDRLCRAEKSKELAHIELVDRTRENEAVRMIRVKEGMRRIGSSYLDLANKSKFVFSSHHKISSEIPDIHDRALQNIKFRGSVCAQHVQEAKDKVRLYRETSLTNTKAPVHDPPPPYSPASDGMNTLSRELSSTSLSDTSSNNNLSLFTGPSAPTQSLCSLNSASQSGPISPVGTARLYPNLESHEVPYRNESSNANADTYNARAPETSLTDSLEGDGQLVPNGEIPLLELRATRARSKKRKSTLTRNTSSETELPPANPDFNPPPPYNPFYEWSSFHTKDK